MDQGPRRAKPSTGNASVQCGAPTTHAHIGAARSQFVIDVRQAVNARLGSSLPTLLLDARRGTGTPGCGLPCRKPRPLPPMSQRTVAALAVGPTVVSPAVFGLTGALKAKPL